MKIKIIRPVRVSSIGKMVLGVDAEIEVEDSAAEVYIRLGFAEAVELKKQTQKSKK